MTTPRRHAPRGKIKADPMEPQNPMERPRCTATNRQGKRCGKEPIAGGTVCRMHGGSAPQVQLKAEERLKALVEPAIQRLHELMLQKEFPSVAIAATKDILDRDGKLGKAKETQDVNLSGAVDIVSLLRKRRDRNGT